MCKIYFTFKIYKMINTTHIGEFDVYDEKTELNFDLNDFFTKEINKKDIIKKYGNICHISIHSLHDSAYIYNLRKLPKLNSLNIGNVDNVLFFDELCNLKKLNCLTLYAKKKYVVHKKKMLIFDFCKKIKNPKKIKHLHIVSYEDKYINNLPDNIETLILSNVNNLPINNLPINLKKIIIFQKDIEYLDNTTGEFMTINITENDIKMPHGCELIIN